jgi:hypothetical protein
LRFLARFKGRPFGAFLMMSKKRSSDEYYKFLQKILSVFSFVFLGVLKSFLNTQIGQGFLKKVVNWLADTLYDEAVKPALEVLLVRVGYKYDVKEGKVLIERLKQAEESGNATDWDSTVDDINN